ncbi:MAG TPA: glycosyltransferase, partial [Thermoanaerobaculia bacterium]
TAAISRTDVRFVDCDDRNPAVRRNRGAALAQGDLLAFIDDDAFADPTWIENAVARFDANPDILAIGGPDPAPNESSVSELFSDTLLSTPWIGSGIAAHENREGAFDIRSPHDLALVNLFVRKEAFPGFDESIGYIGEDTALVAGLMRKGRVAYHSAVVVRHRRRPFPVDYLKQRWRYRVKTGRLLASGAKSYRNAQVIAFLAVGIVFLATLVIAPPVAAALLGIYVFLTFLLGVSVTRLSLVWWPLIPIAFGLHHATYFAGLVTGLALGTASRLAPPRAIHENTDRA